MDLPSRQRGAYVGRISPSLLPSLARHGARGWRRTRSSTGATSLAALGRAGALPADAVEDGTPENTGCLYSGKRVTHLMDAEGRVFGFCNAFCRDKTVADPLAWPAFAAAWERRAA
jgi:hypothetical protein